MKGVPFFNKWYIKGVPFLPKWYIKGEGVGPWGGATVSWFVLLNMFLLLLMIISQPFSLVLMLK